MKLIIPKKDQNLISAMRQISYHPDRHVQTEEPSFSKPLMGRPYPRFHIYIKDTEDEWVFKLHLDQKKPSYVGAAAHSGEYEGPTIEAEAERIKQILHH